MLRTALKILLAVVLCLNGFLTPVAMAAQGRADDAITARATAPCHGDEAAATFISTDQPADPQAPSHPDCCKRGHCLCAALFSLQVPELDLPALTPQTERVVVHAGVHFASLRGTVPLRPPIA